jgi:hypothetical protein
MEAVLILLVIFLLVLVVEGNSQRKLDIELAKKRAVYREVSRKNGWTYHGDT